MSTCQLLMNAGGSGLSLLAATMFWWGWGFHNGTWWFPVTSWHIKRLWSHPPRLCGPSVWYEQFWSFFRGFGGTMSALTDWCWWVVGKKQFLGYYATSLWWNLEFTHTNECVMNGPRLELTSSLPQQGYDEHTPGDWTVCFCSSTLFDWHIINVCTIPSVPVWINLCFLRLHSINVSAVYVKGPSTPLSLNYLLRRIFYLPGRFPTPSKKKTREKNLVAIQTKSPFVHKMTCCCIKSISGFITLSRRLLRPSACSVFSLFLSTPLSHFRSDELRGWWNPREEGGAWMAPRHKRFYGCDGEVEGRDGMIAARWEVMKMASRLRGVCGRAEIIRHILKSQGGFGAMKGYFPLPQYDGNFASN